MGLWIRYDASRGIWEVSPNESEHYFSDLVENHPREVTFSRWIEFEAFADAKNMGVHRQPEESLGGRRIKVFNDGDFLREVRKRKGRTEAWGPNQVDTPPAVAPVGRARIYFDKITNRLKVSENGGSWKILGAATPLVLTQEDPDDIPLKIVAPATPFALIQPDAISGLQAWWKADAGAYVDAGVTLATNGQAVQQWNDQSGNGRNLSQATASARPLFMTGIRNGQPVLRFDTTDVFVSNIGDDIITASAGTVFVVWETPAAPGTAPWMLYNGLQIAAIQSSGSFNMAAVNYDGSSDSAIKAATVDTWYCHTWMHLGGSIYLGQNDTRIAEMASAASGNTSSLAGSDMYTRGVSTFLNTDLAEIICYNVALSEDDRKGVEAYLANKYGLALPYVAYGNVDLFRVEDDSGDAIFRVSNTGDVYVGASKLNVP